MHELVRADGRWGRILNALSQRPASFGALIRQVRDREHTNSVDRAKCLRAVRAMLATGLIEGSYLQLYITDRGRTSFAAVQRQEPSR